MNEEIIRLFALLRWLARPEEYDLSLKKWQLFQMNDGNCKLHISMHPTLHIFEFCEYLGCLSESSDENANTYRELILFLISNNTTISRSKTGFHVIPSIPNVSSDNLRKLYESFRRSMLIDKDKEYIPSKSFNIESTMLAVAILKSLKVSRIQSLNSLLSFGLFTKSENFHKERIKSATSF